MVSYRVVVLGVIGILFVTEDLCTARNMKLDVSQDSYKEGFFKSRKDSDWGNFKTDDSEAGDPLSDDDFEGDFEEKEMAADPISKSKYFEGDIGTKFSDDKNSIEDDHTIWPEGEVTYAISKAFDKQDRSIIAKAMKEFEKSTCIKFKPRKDEKDYVNIVRGDGCLSMIGKTGGSQVLKLAEDCMHVPIIMHELMHAIGFWHEQVRPDRDDYVTIKWENIQEGQEYNFNKYDTEDYKDEEYDYDSLMHYDSYVFSKFPDKPTILPKKKGIKLEKKKGFSPADIRRINKKYECDSSSKGKSS